MGHVLWMINHYAALPTEAGGTRHYWLGMGLQGLGWDVRILRCGPTKLQRWPWQPQVRVVDGLEITTLPGPPSSARGVRRISGWAQFTAWIQAPTTTKHLPQPDLVFGSTVHLGAALAAQRLAEHHRVPFVLEIRDLWPETLIAMGALKRDSAVARAMYALERRLARSAALIVSPLAGVGEYLTEHHGIPSDRFLWVSNGVNTDQYAQAPPRPTAGLRLQYFGAIGAANDVGSIVDAVEQANEELAEPVQLQVFGAGPQRNPLIDRVSASPHLSPFVTFPEPVASEEVPMAMAWGNGLVLTVRHLPSLYRYGISMNKLFDYLASGRWIIMGSDVPNNPVAEAPGVSLCEPSAGALSSAIITAARMDPQERERIAQGNIELAQRRYEYRVLAQKLAASLERILPDRGSARL